MRDRRASYTRFIITRQTTDSPYSLVLPLLLYHHTIIELRTTTIVLLLYYSPLYCCCCEYILQAHHKGLSLCLLLPCRRDEMPGLSPVSVLDSWRNSNHRCTIMKTTSLQCLLQLAMVLEMVAFAGGFVGLPSVSVQTPATRARRSLTCSSGAAPPTFTELSTSDSGEELLYGYWAPAYG